MRPLAIAAMLLAVSGAAGEPRLWFDVEQASWDAAAVVVVTEEEQLDGEVLVLESWVGSLEAGDRISVPQLAAFAPERRRTIVQRWIPARESRATHVTGQRMILFLAAGEAEPAVAWVEDGQLFAFVQLMVPGESELMAIGVEERDAKLTVETFISARERLAEALQSGEPERVAAVVRSLFRSASPHSRMRILSVVGDHGVAGAAAAREVLRDASELDYHQHAIRALARAAGPAAAPDLVELLEQELRFWKTAGPGLREGWWNDEAIDEKERSLLRTHYGRALEALWALKRNDAPGAAAAVTAFCEQWGSLPQLRTVGGGQLGRECGELLRR